MSKRLAQIQKRIKDWKLHIVDEAPCEQMRSRGRDLLGRLQVVATRVWEQKTATAADIGELEDLERQLWALNEEVRLTAKTVSCGAGS